MPTRTSARVRECEASAGHRSSAQPLRRACRTCCARSDVDRGSGLAPRGGMQAPASQLDKSDPPLLLSAHHEALHAACNALRAHTYGGDALELIARFRAFENALLQHLVLEECEMLPAYELEDPFHAAAIRHDHVEIRALLSQLGLEVELHVARATTIERLLAMLRAHAAREEEWMYAWAECNLSNATRRELFVKLGRSLRALAGDDGASPVPPAP